MSNKNIRPGVILPLWPLGADLVLWNPGSSDEAMVGVHNYGGDPDPEVSTRMVLGLPPLGSEVAVQTC